jgi:hypothetical protein
VTSNTPPLLGISVMPPGKSSGRVCRRCSAKLAARVSYPQDVQNSICIVGVGSVLAMGPSLR